jgi:hypothetical protein
MNNVNRSAQFTRTLVASAARTATGVSDATYIPDAPNAIAFVLDVTAAATAAGDTLDVKIQTTLDGATWTDVVAFTQVLGNGGAKYHIAKVAANAAQTMFENGASLSAGSVRNLLGDTYRAAWSITDAPTDDASFTFSIKAIVM